MEKQYFIGFLIVIIAIIFIFRMRQKSNQANNVILDSPISDKKNRIPAKLVENDKLIIAKNVEEEKLKQSIQKFCDLYNLDAIVAIPQLVKSGNAYIITFPYDIDFATFCYFVNYIIKEENIANHGKPHYDIKAWTTTKPGDEWMDIPILNKEVMLFIPDWDEEHDNVYLTTEDNFGYKMGFAVGHETKRLEKPVMNFQPRPKI